MGVDIKTIFDLVSDSLFPTDLHKYKDFFDEMGVRYIMREYDNHIYLCIHHSHVNQIYGNAVEIEFDEDEKFIQFRAWGE